jgi:hypothetical protein
MNKEYKPVNNTFREHWKLHGYLSPSMIEELLDKVDDLEVQINEFEHGVDELNNKLDYWREKCYEG